MSDFFRGWKRKLGVLILILTCGLLVIWVRSFSTTDDHFTVWRNCSLYSHNGSVSWNVPYQDSSQFNGEWTPTLVRQKSRWEFCGIVFSDQVVHGSGLRQYWISDWYLIAPLTGLAGWLLLSNGRRSTLNRATVLPSPQLEHGK